MDITIGASLITGFQPSAVGADIALSGMSVTNGSPNITGTNFLPQSVVGLGGFKITFSTGVTYTVATVTSRSALTLTANYNESTTTVSGTLHKLVHLRVYVMTPFVPSGETFVAQSGAPGSTAWFRRYGVSVISDGSQNVAHIPQIVLPATTDSSVPTARYFAGLYTQSGAFIQEFPGCVSEFRLDSATTPTSWAQICEFNSPPNPAPPNPINFYTTQQIDARFPSGLANQLLFYKATGNVLKPLTLDAAFTITSDTLFLAGPSGVNRIQEEGSNLPQRQILNFIGSSFTAADDVPNVRTNVTADADLNALASNASNGLWARTGAGTGAARTVTGTTGQVTLTNGDGVAGNPTVSLPTTVFLGTAGGSPAAGTLTGPDASGTDITGAALDLTGGKGTGSANPGLVSVRYPLHAASGTTLQSLSGDRFPVVTSLYTNTTFGSAISNTTTETNLFTGASASAGSTRILEAGLSSPGTLYRGRMEMEFTTTGTPTGQLRVKLNGVTVIIDTGAFNMPTGAANGFAQFEFYILVNAVGASGSFSSRGRFEAVPTTGVQTPTVVYGKTLLTINTTINLTIDVTWQWGTASASNSINMTLASIERLR